MRRQGLALTLREARSFFNGMTGWILLAAFMLLSSFFTLSLGQFILREGETNSQIYFQTISLLFTFLLPALSMGTWAGETRRGTLDLLKSLPFTLRELVFFKALGIYLVFGALVATTLPFLAMVLPLANFEIGVVVTQFLGVILLGLAQLSFGILISALSRSQIIAYLSTLFVFLLLLIGQAITALLGTGSWIGALFRFLSLEAHFQSFRKGVFSSSDFVYFILISVLLLFLTKAILEEQKER